MLRILIHDTILAAMTGYQSEREQENSRNSATALRELVTDTCHSVPYILAHRRSMLRPGAVDNVADLPTPGGYLLLLPFYLAGISKTLQEYVNARRCMFVCSEIPHETR
jgi:hypothetical protein